IASGSADVPLQLCRKARASGVNLEITASDFSSRATSFAQQQCAGEPAISFLQLNALTDQYPHDFDVVSNSLFVHHLDPDDVTVLLKKMSQAAKHMVLISDLRRCRTGLMLAHVAGRLFTNSAVVHYDGPVSVRAAYTIPEVSKIAQDAGLHDVTV